MISSIYVILNKYFCIHETIGLIIVKMKIKIKNGSYIYDINRPRPRHGQNTLLIKCS